MDNKLPEEFIGIDEFFSAIRSKCSNEEEYAVELVKARGFLLDDGELSLSDNSHVKDEEFLEHLLKEGKIGRVSGGNLVMSNPQNMEVIFCINNHIGGEAFQTDEDWGKFVHNSHAPKICISVLEPFVARYVKAISACGVSTWCSCDGNHPGKNSIHVNTICGPNSLWHKIICQKIISKKFKLNWNNIFEKIDFGEDNKWKTYFELNQAGEYLYNNREKLLEIRQKASRSIGNSRVRRLSDDELSKLFYEEASKLIDQQLVI